MSEEEQIDGRLRIDDMVMSPEGLAAFNRQAEEAETIAAETGLATVLWSGPDIRDI